MFQRKMRRLSMLLVGAVTTTSIAFSGAAHAATDDPKPPRPEPRPDSARLLGIMTLGPHLIRNKLTEKCIDIPGTGNGKIDGPVQQHSCIYDLNGDNQYFYLDDLGIGDGYFNIRNVKDGLCLDVPYYGWVPPTTPVSEYTCDYTYSDNQLFYMEFTASGYIWIRHRNTDFCLDVAGFNGSGGEDARLTLYPCNLLDDHEWSLRTNS